MSEIRTELSIPEIFEATMRAHYQGEREIAARGYELLRKIAPSNPDTWHLSGVFEGQRSVMDLAEQYIRRAIELDPRQASFHNNLGNVLSRSDRMDEAEQSYRRAIELDPRCYDARNNLGLLTRWRGDLEAAEKIYLDLLAEVPGFTDARQNIVSLYTRMGKLKDAIVQAATGLMTSPRHPLLRRMLGRAYADYGAPEKAIELYRKWAEEEPEHPEPKHYLAALLGEGIPDRASDPYVRATFSGFAASFDAKLAELDYKAPALIGECVAEVLGDPDRSLRITDAGCGTGLCAQYLSPYASRLVGVDLTQEMLDRARSREVYDELVLGELVAYLAAHPRSCELLVSADTLCYFGRLQEFAAAARGSLVPGGWLAFTVEAHDDGPDTPDYRLHTHGRYSHRRGYVAEVLAGAGFVDLTLREVALRRERGEPVRGWLTRARLPAEGSAHG